MNCKYSVDSRCQLELSKHLRIAQDLADCSFQVSTARGTMPLRGGSKSRATTFVWSLLFLASFCLPTIYSHGEPQAGDEDSHRPSMRLDKNVVQDKE